MTNKKSGVDSFYTNCRIQIVWCNENSLSGKKKNYRAGNTKGNN